MKDGLPLSERLPEHWPRALPPKSPPNGPHRGDTPPPDESREAQERRIARNYLDTLYTPSPVPGDAACWVLWGPGVPCLHPDGLGHCGPHGHVK